MAYSIDISLEEDPSPYPLCELQYQPAPGREHVSWHNYTLPGERVRPEWQPQSVLRAVCTPEDLCSEYSPDLSFVVGGVPCLSTHARDLIESLEPQVHQFFPVDMFDLNGAICEPRRYILNVCQLVDAIIDGFLPSSRRRSPKAERIRRTGPTTSFSATDIGDVSRPRRTAVRSLPDPCRGSRSYSRA